MTLHARRSTALLFGMGLLIIALGLSTQGGPLADRVPALTTLGPLALESILALTISVVWPQVAVIVAMLAPSFAPDELALGASLTCLAAAVLVQTWRRTARGWGSASAFLVFSAIVLLASVGAPVSPPPTARVYFLYAGLVGAASVILAVHPRWIISTLTGTGLYFSYAAITTTALQTDRGGVVVRGLNANGLGFMCALSLLGCVMLVASTHSVGRLLALAGAAWSLAGLVQTGSRGGLLAALVGVAAYIAGRCIQRFTIRAVLTTSLSAFALYWVSGPATRWLANAAGRNLAAIDVNITSRESATLYAVQAAARYPGTGVGLSALDRYTYSDPNASYHLSAHNVFIERFAESGAVAGLIFAIAVACAIVVSWRHSRYLFFPFVLFLFASGVSLDWVTDGRTGPIAFALFGSLFGALAYQRRQKQERNGDTKMTRNTQETLPPI